MSDTTITEPATEPVEAAETATVEAPEELGKGGLAALQAEREARKAAETKLKEFEDRDKTEAERQQEALATAKAELESLATAKARAEVAAEKAVPTTLLAGPASNSAEDIAKFADALLAFRGEERSNRLHVPNEGKSPRVQINDEKQFVGELFGSGD